MDDRKTLLDRLNVGDIFHATGSSGASFICLVLSITKTTIRARRIGPQQYEEFDRQTGVKIDNKNVVIDSVAPLPEKIRDTLLNLDQRYERGEDPKPSEAEWDMFDFISDFYPAHPLPE